MPTVRRLSTTWLKSEDSPPLSASRRLVTRAATSDFRIGQVPGRAQSVAARVPVAARSGRQSASSYSTTSGCATTSAGECGRTGRRQRSWETASCLLRSRLGLTRSTPGTGLQIVAKKTPCQDPQSDCDRARKYELAAVVLTPEVQEEQPPRVIRKKKRQERAHDSNEYARDYRYTPPLPQVSQ
jgi:hypothetical protein